MWAREGRRCIRRFGRWRCWCSRRGFCRGRICLLDGGVRGLFGGWGVRFVFCTEDWFGGRRMEVEGWKDY